MNKRQQIVNLLLSKLTAIKAVNGYSLTVKSVSDYRKKPLTIQELPAIIIQDGSANVSNEDSGLSELTHKMTVNIDLFMHGIASVFNCREAMSDIVKSLGPSPTMDLPFDSWIDVTGHELAMEIDSDICGAGRVTIVVTYISNNLEI